MHIRMYVCVHMDLVNILNLNVMLYFYLYSVTEMWKKTKAPGTFNIIDN